MSFLVNLVLGLIFGAGLVISGMANPAKVLNFLAFVMGGAVIVAFFGYRLVFRRPAPIVGAYHLPAQTEIDSRLVTGAVIFGAGWGLSGFCPGPAIVALGLGEPGTLVFVPGMIVGMWAARLAAARTGFAYPE
jgi:uncharacterized protein